MCGIIGYSGHRPAVPLLVEGLSRLEYRGYDSAGVAFVQGGEMHAVKAEGKLAALEDKLAGQPNFLATAGIGHTRWATHGVPAERNSHPHLAGEGAARLALVHNGIIENYQTLKQDLLAKGIEFKSETDSEVLAWVIAEELAKTPDNPMLALAAALRKAHGAYAVAMTVLGHPGEVYAARMAAPLLLGVGVGECFIASDIPAFLPYTREVVFLEDGEIAHIKNGQWAIFSFEELAPIARTPQHIPWDMQAAQKDGYKHFMLKEIMEQPKVITDALAGRLVAGGPGGSGGPNEPDGRMVNLPELQNIQTPERLHIVACGTSYNAGLWSRNILEELAGIPTTVEIASEFRYRNPLLLPGEAVLVISQSGETADTLSALRLAKEKGCPVIGLCNVLGSSIAREADAVVYTQAGPEISVASTKAMCSQMLALVLISLHFAHRKGMNAASGTLFKALEELPALLEQALPSLREQARQLARSYSGAKSFFYLGRGQAYSLALEGALKLKELSYIHAEGYAAGEMKHGPIALIDPDFPTFALALDDDLLPKVKSNIVEVKARRGKVIAVVQEGGESDWDVDDIWVLPRFCPMLSGFLALPAVQLFSYEMADYLGNDVDQPRNLAKSVTVE